MTPALRAALDVLNGESAWTIQHTDFVRTLEEFPDACVDAIFTDPPYDVESLPLFARVYEHASRILKPNGHLVMIVPAYTLDPFNSRLAPMVDWSKVTPAPKELRFAKAPPPNSSRLRFRWLCTMKQTAGSHPRLPSTNFMLKVTKKDLCWWTAYPLTRRNYAVVNDSYENDPPPSKGKKKHKWQQSSTWAQYLLQLLQPGSVVLDPMAGSGTMPAAAIRAGHRIIGFDIDETSALTSRESCEEAAS